MDARGIQEKLGLTEQRLKIFCQEGYVRNAKLGNTRQAASLYNTQDVLEALERIAAGYTPRKKRRAP